MNIDKLKDIVQDCNINFLFGSGMSASYLSVLGAIEVLLTDANKIEDKEKKKIIKSSLYKLYFDGVIEKNTKILSNDVATQPLMSSYKNFFEIFNRIILERRNTLLSKQINIFTTNIDICLEKALEDKGFEYNDGFSGNFNPKFDLSNYKKSLFKRSLHFENVSEIPMFNIYKIHGSLTWEVSGNNIVFSKDLNQIKKIDDIVLTAGTMIDIEDEDDINALETKVGAITYSTEIDDFMREYEKLAIVNPTKDKFRETILNQTYYELLRIYANELEKENTVLFVMGFSFADEHIRELTLRVANSNPTLQIFIFAFDNTAKLDLATKIGTPRHNNIKIISPLTDEDGNENFLYTFDEINTRIYEELEEKVLEGA
jgi:hypothetical protein